MRQLVLALVFLALGAGLATTVTASSSEADGLWLHVANGARVKTPDRTAVYIVDRGVLRHVHYDAYRRLWSGWGGIVLVNEIPATTVGEPMRGGCRLVRVPGERAVWFIDNDRVRRHVPSLRPASFDSRKIAEITCEELERYEEGPALR